LPSRCDRSTAPQPASPNDSVCQQALQAVGNQVANNGYQNLSLLLPSSYESRVLMVLLRRGIVSTSLEILNAMLGLAGKRTCLP
jgi:hypothetical protein